MLNSCYACSVDNVQQTTLLTVPMSYHQFVNQETGERYGSFSVNSYENKLGFYWIACFPGCLPDGDYEPCGPFDTEQQAIDDANAGA